MKRILLGLLLVVVMIGAVGCGGITIIGTGRVEGYVYYPTQVSRSLPLGEQPKAIISRIGHAPEGYAPLEGALVYLEEAGMHTTTGSDGRFVFSGVESGTYTIVAVHDNFKYALESTVTVYSGQTARPEFQMGIGYYILIGVGNYQDPNSFPTLQGPANDIVNVYNHLVVDNKWFGNGYVFAEILEDEQATKEQIRATIQDAVVNLHEEDYLVIYFSGHGAGGDGFYADVIAPYDADVYDSASLITDGELYEWVQWAETEDITLIVDACNSGSLADGRVRAISKAFLDKPYNVIFSSSPDEESRETSYWGDWQGLFTHFLVDGVQTREADSDYDGFIYVDEIYEYTRDQVANWMDSHGTGETQTVTAYFGSPEIGYIFEY